MANFIKSIPLEEERILVQSRISKSDYRELKRAGVKMPELIRQACAEAARQLRAQRERKG